jgi:type VI secretion system protein ImpH
MAGTDGQTTDSLIQQIAGDPFRFDFCRAVRLLQASQPDRPRVGYSLSPQEDFLRFWQNPSLAFAPSTIESMSVVGGKPRLAVNFFGLFGPAGPLPPHLTEYARDRQRHADDPTFVAFANIFHQRLLTFFFRAWSANQKALDLDRSGEQRYPSYIGSFFGLGLEGVQNRDAVPDWAKLYFSGRLSCPTRNAEGLEAILQAYFEIKTCIETFCGHWIDLPKESLCKLGDSPETGTLGLTAIVGSKLWDCQLKFRIVLGPMSLIDYERMLPDGSSFKCLQDWVLNYLGHEFIFDVRLILKVEEVPAMQLGQSGKLGWTTWLKSKPLPKDPDDLLLNGSSN